MQGGETERTERTETTERESLLGAGLPSPSLSVLSVL